MLRVVFVDLVGKRVDVFATVVVLTIGSLWQLRFHEETLIWSLLARVWTISCR